MADYHPVKCLKRENKHKSEAFLYWENMGELLITKYRGLESAVFYSQVKPGYTHGCFEILDGFFLFYMYVLLCSVYTFFSSSLATHFPAYSNIIKHVIKNRWSGPGNDISGNDIVRTISPNANHIITLVIQFDESLE
ncbi:hypothetical protein [Methanosarcina sp. UBA411]|jgi:hypothetical protein|uniref:hypothetical protein n=1 Tax=Methanosarcina sp. UBA411 TaxID=1915589 RepID=UPI0025FC6506|nr:hypothetical protein [Methanosarcina sp. UBA411]